MKKIFILFFILASFVFAQTQITTKPNAEGKNITIVVENGATWNQNTKYGPVIPQIAVWVEDTHGNFMETLYVTRAFGQQKMRGLSATFSGVFRRVSLPYWLGRNYTKTKKYPTQFSPLPDTLTSATPQGSFSLNTVVETKIDKCYVFVEVNNSSDINETYRDALDGQPSLIYKGLVQLNKKGSYKLTLAGQSEINFDGVMKEDISKITTARNIITTIIVNVN